SKFTYRPERKDSARYNWFEALLSPSKYREATGNDDYIQFGLQQNLSLSMGQLIPSQFLNVSENASYHESWFPSSIRKRFLPDSNEVVDRRIRGFNATREFNTSLNFSTTVYGLMNAKIGNFESFRHTFRPSVSVSYRPDFSADFWGNYRTVQTDTSTTADGTPRTQRYSIFEDQIFSGPGRGEQRALSLSLNNTFEGKKVRRDSTGEKKEEVVRLIDQLSLSTGYNFAADSLKLSDLNASVSAHIVKGMNIRASANFNFYDRNERGTKIDKFLLTTTGKPFEMTRFSASTSYSFSWGKRGLQAQNREPHYPAHYNPLNQSIFHPVDPHFNTQPVQDFNSPFSFDVNFSYRWSLNPTGSNRTSATINANNITLNLTPKWNFRTQIG